jgi:sugar/nucleoside kinase (ribokinase family)
MTRLVLVGSVIVDLVMPVPRLPERGGDLLATGAEFRVGGGRYVLDAAAQEGIATAFAGRYGRGPFGERVRAVLTEIGTELLFAPDADGDTGVCVVLVEPDGERTFVTSAGVEGALTRALLDSVELAAGDWVYVSGYDLAYDVSGPALGGWLPAVRADVRVVLDPGPLVGDIPAAILDAALRRTDVLTLNARETAVLAGTSDRAAAAAALLPRLAADALLVLRDGPGGCWLASVGAEPVHVDAVAVADVRDTTGAGDVHTGALIAHLAAGDPPLAAATAANTAAARHVSA